MSSSPSFEKVGECLYRNPSSGTYFARVKHNGKEIKRSLGTNHLQEALRKLKDFKDEIERTDPSVARMTLGQLVAKYLLSIEFQAEGTKTAKVRACERFQAEVPSGADQLVAKIKPSDVTAFLSRFKGASLYNTTLETVRQLFLVAVKDKVISKSPLEGMTYRKRQLPIRQTPTTKEFRLIVESIRSQPLADTREESADGVEFLGLSGLGKAEAAALCWADVNFDRGQIITFRQKTSTGFAIPMFPQLRPLLERKYAMACVKNSGNPPLPETKVFTVVDPKKSLAAACVRLNLPNYSSRAFRRLFITTAIERGIDVKVIAQWQGHKDGGKLILDTYSHVRPAHSERMAQLMTSEDAK